MNNRLSNKISGHSARAGTFLTIMDMQLILYVKSREGEEFENREVKLQFWLSSFNWGCNLIRRMISVWWDVSQCSFAVILND